jgi:hypothetical protein
MAWGTKLLEPLKGVPVRVQTGEGNHDKLLKQSKVVVKKVLLRELVSIKPVDYFRA